MKFKTALFASMLLVAGSAAAAEDSGFYVGAGIGYGKMNVNENKLNNMIDNAFASEEMALQVTKSNVGQGATPWDIMVGYKFMKYFAVELAYYDLGNADYKATVYDYIGEENVGSVKAQWEASGWPVSLVGIWPINDQFDVFGKVGMFFGDVKLSAKAKDFNNALLLGGSDSENSNEFIGGVGADWHFMDKWTARAEWQAMPSLGNNKVGDGNWNDLQFNIIYSF